MPKWEYGTTDGQTVVIEAGSVEEADSIFAASAQGRASSGGFRSISPERGAEIFRGLEATNTQAFPESGSLTAGAIGTSVGGPIIGGATGALVEAARQSLTEEDPNIASIALQGVAPKAGQVAGGPIRAIGRGLQKAGTRVSQTVFPNTQRTLNDASTAFNVPIEQARERLGLEAASRGMARTPGLSGRFLDQEVAGLGRQQSDILTAARDRGVRFSAPQIANRAVREVTRGPLGQQGASEKARRAVRGQADEFLRDRKNSRLVTRQVEEPIPPAERGTILNAQGQLASAGTRTRDVQTRVPRRDLTPMEVRRQKTATVKANNMQFQGPQGTQEGPVPSTNRALADSMRRELNDAIPELQQVDEAFGRSMALRSGLQQAKLKAEGMATATIPEMAAVSRAGTPTVGSGIMSGVALLQRPAVAGSIGQKLFGTGRVLEQGLSNPTATLPLGLALSEEALERSPELIHAILEEFERAGGVDRLLLGR